MADMGIVTGFGRMAELLGIALKNVHQRVTKGQLPEPLGQYELRDGHYRGWTREQMNLIFGRGWQRKDPPIEVKWARP